MLPGGTVDGERLFGQHGSAWLLVEASLVGLNAFAREDSLDSPADYRLAFRELGLSIGLGALERLPELVERNEHSFVKEQNLRVR